jgi:hypothetical protein
LNEPGRLAWRPNIVARFFRRALSNNTSTNIFHREYFIAHRVQRRALKHIYPKGQTLLWKQGMALQWDSSHRAKAVKEFEVPVDTRTFLFFPEIFDRKILINHEQNWTLEGRLESSRLVLGARPMPTTKSKARLDRRRDSTKLQPTVA